VPRLTLPVSWRGTVAQDASRQHRLHDAKREGRVCDYANVDVPMLARMFDRRCRGCEAIDYTVLLPACATPGWPADVTLPADPAWKRDYSGSVRRLIRDGVDSPPATPSYTPFALPRPTRTGSREQESQRRHFSSGAWSRLQRPRGDSR
jgi:hypothetical protein